MAGKGLQIAIPGTILHRRQGEKGAASAGNRVAYYYHNSLALLLFREMHMANGGN